MLSAVVIQVGEPNAGPPPGQAPTANFTTDGDVFYVGDTIQCHDTSLNNPTSWQWYFNNNLFSNDQNPQFYVTIAGQLNSVIQLTATNSYGSSEAFKTVQIPV